MTDLTATAADLPPAVAAALAAASPDLANARRSVVLDGGYQWSVVAWGDPSDPPVLLVHGVTSNAETFWRVGPALARAGRHVVAVDLPGHGRTGGWMGRHRFLETASELAGMVRAAGLDRPDLAVLGHSWGALVVAALPTAGLIPDRLILLDPPALSAAIMELMTHDPVEKPYGSLDEAETAIGTAYPGWTHGDVRAKALGLTQFHVGGVLAVLTENGDWDAGLAALSDPVAATVTVWVIRGVPEAGSLVPAEVVPKLEARIGADHVITIAGAPHSPQRTHPEATVLAILMALGEWPRAGDEARAGGEARAAERGWRRPRLPNRHLETVRRSTPGVRQSTPPKLSTTDRGERADCGQIRLGSSSHVDLAGSGVAPESRGGAGFRCGAGSEPARRSSGLTRLRPTWRGYTCVLRWTSTARRYAAR